MATAVINGKKFTIQSWEIKPKKVEVPLSAIKVPEFDFSGMRDAIIRATAWMIESALFDGLTSPPTSPDFAFVHEPVPEPDHTKDRWMAEVFGETK